MAGRRAARRAAQNDLVLGPVLDLAAAAPLAAALLARRGMDCVLDGDAVTRLGGQCLQVLLAAAATWRHDGHALRIVHATPELGQALRLFGADALLPPERDDRSRNRRKSESRDQAESNSGGRAPTSAHVAVERDDRSRNRRRSESRDQAESDSGGRAPTSAHVAVERDDRGRNRRKSESRGQAESNSGGRAPTSAHVAVERDDRSRNRRRSESRDQTKSDSGGRAPTSAHVAVAG